MRPNQSPRCATLMKSYSRRTNFDAIGRVKAWTRERFALAPDDAVLIAELACGLPGCPPRETVIAFWTAPGRRHSFKVFKPLDDVIEDDLPPAWMKDAIIGGNSFNCC